MRRRDFIAGLGGAAAWPVAVGAQQRDGIRRIGALMFGVESDQVAELLRTAFEQGLQKQGWAAGRNLEIEYRWPGAGDDVDRYRKLAAELVRLRPDVILAVGAPALEPFAQATSSIPIVFALVADPIGLGLVNSMARPGGNITGFIVPPPSIAGKWLELLKEIAPKIKRVAILSGAQTGSYTKAFLPYAETAAGAYGVEGISSPCS